VGWFAGVVWSGQLGDWKIGILEFWKTGIQKSWTVIWGGGEGACPGHEILGFNTG